MLFFKECRKVICSMTYLLYVATVVVMYISQFTCELDTPVMPPRENLDFYGMKTVEIPELLMPAATEGLVSEYLSGSYVGYPFGFYKEVKLRESKQAQIAGIIEAISGISRKELDEFKEFQKEGYEGAADENGNIVLTYQEAVLPEIHMPEDMSYERFRELMRQADRIIGGGSRYSDQYIVRNFSQVPMSYEDALAEYEEMMRGNNLAEGYARLYCDYMGIDLAIMPVFVCVSLWQMDKKARMQQLIYSRKISSVKTVVVRYLALAFCTVIPVALTFIHAMTGVKGLYPEQKIAYGSSIALTMLWLLPGILAVLAAGTLVSEALSPLCAIFVQGIWWFLSLSSNQLTGSITRYTLLIRHNSLEKAGLFEEQYFDFLWNRSFYIILSVAAVGIAALLYDRHRKGKLQYVRKNTER